MSGRKRHPGKQQATGRAKGCQDSKMSRANQIKRKLHHQAWISRERNVEAERVLRTHGVNGRDNRPVRRRSYRLSLFFTSVTRLARDLLVFYMYTVYCVLYIHIYIILTYCIWLYMYSLVFFVGILPTKTKTGVWWYSAAIGIRLQPFTKHSTYRFDQHF